MARLIAMVDRPPADKEWKGAFAWKMILALAESQHEVLALTTLDPAEIEIAHPRLTVANPAPTWRLNHSAAWLKAILQFQPEVLHSFGISRMTGPSALTIWPYLGRARDLFPRLRAYSTVFDEDDFAPFEPIKTPLDFFFEGEQDEAKSTHWIIPMPVSRWIKPKLELLMLADHLEQNPDREVMIIGGWGNYPVRERRAGWAYLKQVRSRIHMCPEMDFQGFLRLARNSAGFWLRSMPPTSWTARVSALVAENFHLPVIGSVAQLQAGSSANFLSRLYSHH